MSLYVSQVLLEINGQSITDFSAVEEREYELTKQVNLMNKTGRIHVHPRHGCSVDYIIPSDAPEFDFSQVDDGRLTIDYQNGKRVTYTGLSTAKIGSTKHDGDKESTRTVEFIAENRTEE